MKEQEISKATIARMPLYLHFLQEESSKGAQYISSTVIAQNISVSSVLVRKDLALVSSEAGRPRMGFAINRLIVDIEKFLGYDNLSDAIVVGAGGLGRAFLGYEGFKSNGLNILAAFDVAPSADKTDDGKPIYHIDQLESFCRSHKVLMGIITVPSEHAQKVCDQLISCGIKAIWTFAPTHLEVPSNILVQHENMATSLAVLSMHLRAQIKDKK